MDSTLLKSNYILVIEDSKDISDLIADFVVSAGYRVAQAREGYEALEIAKEMGTPALVITDIFMPGMEGLESILRIKEDHPSTKIIAISGGGKYGRQDILSYAKKLGADATLSKPINFDTLIEMIGIQLGGAFLQKKIP